MLQEQLYTSSAVINGQLVPQTRSNNYFANAVGPVMQGVPAGVPQSSGTGYGGGTGGQMTDTARQAAANPFDFAKSPVPLMLIMFVVGFLMLRFIHYKY